MVRKIKTERNSLKTGILTVLTGIFMFFALIITGFAGLYPTEVCAATTHTSIIYTNISDIAVYGHEVENCTCDISEDPSTGTILVSSWMKDGSFYYGHTFEAGTYVLRFSLYLETEYSATNTYILKVDGTDYSYTDIEEVNLRHTLMYEVPVTITAPTTHTVTFVANAYCHGDMPVQTVYEGINTQLNANTFYQSMYHTFTGWNTSADGSGTSYSDQASVNLTADLTLYAQWYEDPSATSGNSSGGGGDGDGGGGSSSGSSIMDKATSEIKTAKAGDAVTIYSAYANEDLMNALVENPGVTAVFVFERNGQQVHAAISNPIIEKQASIYGVENLVGIHNRGVARNLTVLLNPWMTPEEIRAYELALIVDAQNARVGVAPVTNVPVANISNEPAYRYITEAP